MKKRRQSKYILFWLFLFIFSNSIHIPASKIIDQPQKDVIIEALQDELNRSMEKLQLKDMEKPYYIEYIIEDAETYEVNAVFGAIVKAEQDKARRSRVEVRVGSYDLDNSEFFSRRSIYAMTESRPRSTVLEDDYLALRRDLWLTTDRVYKQALEQLAQKRSFIKTKVQVEEISNFTREEAVVNIAPKKEITLDQEKWKEDIRRLSAIFRKFPAVHDSNISSYVKLTHKYYINSEGSIYRQSEPLISLYIEASTQAPDGMQLKHYIPFYGTSFQELPPEKEIAATIHKMGEELTELASAPLLEKYVGPVLVTGEAACELFAQILAPQLSGHRPPLMEEPQMAGMFPENKLAGRLNRSVLPTFFSVVDDPTQKTHGRDPLIGFYNVDDQGVLAQPVTIIENGVLKTLLMSRRPRKEISKSNGHGRAVQLSTPSAQIGNLFLKTTDGKSFEELKKELIDLCQGQGLSHGLLIRKLDNPDITGREFSLASFSMQGDQRREQLTTPILVYKVFVDDGREELVRGIKVKEMSVRMLRDIVSAGNDYYVCNRLTAGGGIIGRAISLSLMYSDRAPVGIPTSIIAPSILFEELELEKPTGPQKKPVLLKHPFFKK